MTVPARELILRNIVAFAFATIIAGAPQVANSDEWNAAAGFAESNIHTINLRQFAKDLEEATNGEIEINVHSGGSLYKLPEIKRAVQTGQVQIGDVLPSIHANEHAVFEADTIPYVADSLDDLQKLSDVLSPIARKIFEEENLILLYTAPWPGVGFFTSKEINSPDDFRGLKIRSYNKNSSRYVELTGAEPTLINASEVPQAFATGIIQGMITSAMTGVDTQAWDYSTNYLGVNSNYALNMVVMNKQLFEGLDEATQKAIMRASEAAHDRGWEMVRTIEAKSKKTLAENGVDVRLPSAETLEVLRTAGTTMQEEWVGRAGDDAKRILEALAE